MTESEWLTGGDPEAMFKRVVRTRRASARVLRLVAAGFWHWQAGRLKGTDRKDVRDRVAKLVEWADTGEPPPGVLPNTSPVIAFWAESARAAAQNAVVLGREWRDPDVSAVVCGLLREVFGNPFRRAKLKPEWRTDTAVALARTMYEADDFGAMPILADALQDAGCASEEVLGHCRAAAGASGVKPAPPLHVRGCWVVDAVLDRH